MNLQKAQKLCNDISLNQLFNDMSNYKYKHIDDRPLLPKLKIGQKINHKKFGNGIILEINGEKSLVEFDSGETKLLLSRFAKFTFLN